MFDNLQDRLGSIFEGLTKRGALSEKDVSEAMREVRRALLEADVALPVARDFIKKVTERAVGQDVLRSVTPGQQVIKIVHDEMISMLAGDAPASGAEEGSPDDMAGIDLGAVAPVPVMMVGLQGSGKTTSTAKVAIRLRDKAKRKVLMASLDVRRPAAQEQLKVLGEQAGIDTLPIVAGQDPVAISKRAMDAGRLGGYDVVMLDTAGRLSVDEALMAEMAEIKSAANPHEILLVADSLTGQDAVTTADLFNKRVGLTGIVLTRADGDGRGGAALSMRAVTGKPIKLLGTGEKLDEMEVFRAERIAGRILGMGDVVSLVEKAAETLDAEKAEKMAAKMKKGQFDLDDLAEQLKQMAKLGGMSGVMAMMPGMGKAKKQMDAAGMDDNVLKRQGAIISSMTKAERRNPKVLNASRKKRVAKGSGTQVQEVNRVLKMHRQMADVFKMMGKKGGKKGLAAMMGAMGGGGGLPPGVTPPGGMGGGLGGPMGGGMPGLGGGMPPGLGGGTGLPGLGAPTLPGLGGPKKK
ncbi:Signal recognition particle, subunit Ffh SRP54 (TC 3.A.5.1.1) [Candidatus Phaeomarinobacter ectocarpi]|uniref:Signal recognition particle protein n=1 Tax=Candidatus Phaeomarinibacter ectocarpi TaxID=1458461 RepID=X5M8A9_9HYPH|nr:signal recognition particle protein [Candidatus Phaeomarinobacter ectocarpi]CDO59523.1 Signal recognition particle, subunit Ffh SRP54 (TC 3.A.5.1.1) [Candidatus Phaeomarinobacter ectocarpi]